MIQWFRGEFHTKTEARQELGVNIIISDEDWYEYLKIFALFLKQSGYAGLLVCIDELVNIYKIPHAITRQYNYEKILTMYNDTLQGKAHYLGIIMGGTPQCMEDPRRGVYSYEALRSRLAEGHFGGEHKDLLAPVIRLQPSHQRRNAGIGGKTGGDPCGVLYGYDPKVTQKTWRLSSGSNSSGSGRIPTLPRGSDPGFHRGAGHPLPASGTDGGRTAPFGQLPICEKCRGRGGNGSGICGIHRIRKDCHEYL